MHVYDSIDAYHLWLTDLERYLRSLFPGQEVEVTVCSPAPLSGF